MRIFQGSRLPQAEDSPSLAALRDRVRRRLCAPIDEPQLASLVAHLRDRHGESLAAVLFYGSCLFAETRTPNSFYDFYLLTDRPLRFFRTLFQAALSGFLPPNVYYGTAAQRPGDERSLAYKSCVLTLAQFVLQTGHDAEDIHHLGRFSKRFAIAYWRDAETCRMIVDGAVRAMLALAPHTLSQLPRRFTLDRFITEQFALSYRGERRVTEPAKVERLVAADRDYYRQVHRLVLDLHRVADGVPLVEGEDCYRQPLPSASCRRRTERFLARSRRRGVLRWPKYILTVDGWLQIQLDKLQRYHGIELELTDRERRHPLIFGWPRFLELRRKGIIRW